MPAFPALNRMQLDRLFAFLTAAREGGDSSVYAPRGPQDELGGPVVGSGGAPGGLKQDFGRSELAAKYPGNFAGPPYPVAVHARRRLYSDYGLDDPFIISPPWSSMAAYDLNKGTLLWKIPLGEDPEAAKEGGKNTGVIQGANHRGIIVTSTGLLFVNCADEMVRAFDADNGNVLWTYQLPAASEGIPSMYEVNGREYLVVGATAGSRSGRESYRQVPASELANRAYIAFALPQ
jgi:quinoprotein glucose dehydrogenase